jgi:hypothetical protein
VTIPPPTVRLGEVLNADLFRRYDESIRNFLIFNHIRFDPEHLSNTELTHRQANELLEELAAEQDESSEHHARNRT